MVSVSTAPLAVISDDLSGAAELAAPWQRGRIALGSKNYDPTRHTFVDTGTRDLSAPQAQVALETTLAQVPGNYLIFKKIDSLLRGNTAVELLTLTRLGYHVLLCPTNPVTDRYVSSGTLIVNDQPEQSVDIPALLAHSAQATGINTPVEVLSIHTVRHAHFGERLMATSTAPGITIIDAHDRSDLARIVAAISALNPAKLVIAGSGGLFAAMYPSPAIYTSPPAHIPFSDDDGAAHPCAWPTSGPLCVAGSTDPVLADQIAAAQADPGAEVVTLVLTHPASALEHTIAALRRGKAVILQAEVSGFMPASPTVIAEEFAAHVATIYSACRPPLAIIGGTSAHFILRALGASELSVEGALATGCAISTLPDGTGLITRPGSYGDTNSLREILTYFRAQLSAPSPLENQETSWH